MNLNLKNTLEETAALIQSPFYLFDTDCFSERLRHLREITQGKADLCFAMKCNPFLTKKAAEFVDRIEVCSFGEYCICRKAGVSPEKLLISGVMKKPEETEKIMRETCGKAQFTAESIFQFALLLKLAEQYYCKLRIYLRYSSGNQFGMDKDSIRMILGMVKMSQYVEIAGLHYYSGSQKSRPEMIAKELRELDEFMTELETEYSFCFRELEYGPGIAVQYFTDQHESRDEEFFGTIWNAISHMTWKGHITLEMGRTAAALCGYYVTHICDIKESNGVFYCITDGGMHHLQYDGQIRGMYHPFIDVLSDKAKIDDIYSREKMKWTICGCLCTANDVLCTGISLGRLRPGDTLVFRNAGAYCMVEGMAMFLCHELPGIYAFSEKTGLTVLREAQDTWTSYTQV